MANDLTPAETAGLDLALVTGVVLAQGSPTLARCDPGPGPRHPGGRRGRPRGAGHPRRHHGRSSTAPPASCTSIPRPALVEEYGRRAADARRAARPAARARRAARRLARRLAVVVAANLGSVADARAALAAGADGAGLVRTEFLFLDRSAAPGVEEQQVEYDAIADAMDGRRITLRTLDVGGDKPLSYLPVPQEANPFLGQRGIRLSLDHRDLLRDQMAAICHTARRSPTSMMIPMVSTPSEMIEALPGADRSGGTGGRPRGPAGRHDDRGPLGGPQDRVVPAPRRLRQHRHQRPDPVHPGGRARERARSRRSPTPSIPVSCS